MRITPPARPQALTGVGVLDERAAVVLAREIHRRVVAHHHLQVVKW